MSIASIHHDPSVTVEMIERFARVDPAGISVFSTFEDQPKAIGQCVRLWREGLELWAEMEISNDAYWPGPDAPHPAPLHAECVVGFEGKTPTLLTVVITSMPRGELASLFQQVFSAKNPKG